MGERRTNRPRKVDSFEILSEIGQGGMGVVYLARQPALERHVVLKKIRRELLANPEIVERFQREARAAAAVHHQNVVTVYHCFSVRGDHYIAQELVDGVDLRSLLDRAGPLDADVAARIALEVARGLEEIHARSIVHRDLKPGNILIGRAGETKIADFGIAFEPKSNELTLPGTMLGSLRYMSPEQMLGRRIDHRSDLFSFGVLLYEMLTGATPFAESPDDDAESMLERMQRERYERPGRRAPSLPWYLRRMVKSCLRANPTRRPESVTAIRRALERRLHTVSPADCRGRIALFLWRKGIVAPAEDTTAESPAPARVAGSAGGRVRRIAIAAALAAVVPLVAIGAAALMRGRPESEPAPAAETAPLTGAPAGDPISPWLEDVDGVAASLAEPALGDEGTAELATDDTTSDETPTEADVAPAEEPALPPVAPVVLEPAQLRFVVVPWAEVQLPDGTRFYTPRASPVALDPGHREVVLVHPTLGRVTLPLDLSAGEERVVRYTFEAEGP